MQKLKFVWEKNAISFSDGAPFILSSLDLGQAERINYTSQQWGTYGVALKGHSAGARIITAKCTLLAENEEELFQLRRKISAVLNPAKQGTLYYCNGFKEYKIDANVQASVVFEEFIGSRRGQFFTVKFYCPDPLFRDLAEEVRELSQVTPRVRFPMVLKPGFITASLAGGDLNIINKGDGPGSLRIEITGPAKNPVVENSTKNQRIAFNYDLAEGDKIIATTHFSHKKVTIEHHNGQRENGFSYIDPETVFFSLEPGENRIRFYEDGKNDRAKCRIYYSPGYFAL